jgi:UDP-N-acetylmuramyl pentapeptide phosphotransferase/UDP-N-acetylglucosamine-1-phosphate transferase
MKNLKKLSLGLILLYVFLISTVALIIILLLRLMPEQSKTIIDIWLVELCLLIGYCLFFYDARRQARKSRKNGVSVMRH